MIDTLRNLITLTNMIASLSVDPEGGAIVDFHLLKGGEVNPLTFAFTKDQMPANNKIGAPFQGHFLCLPRWGLPSANEIQNGYPNHGAFASLTWNIEENRENYIAMNCNSELEEMEVKRKIEFSHNEAFFHVQEKVTNTASAGRLYNMVQHPSIAAPFLHNDILLQCNGTQGFSQFDDINHVFDFPNVQTEKDTFNITRPNTPQSGVFSFTVNKDDSHGWIAAYDPKTNLVFGYIWKREDYPWMHIWQQFSGSRIKYAGIEFGTAGIHQPFEHIIKNGTRKFNTSTVAFLDAGESVTRSYSGFLFTPEESVIQIHSITADTAANQFVIQYNENKTMHFEFINQ